MPLLCEWKRSVLGFGAVVGSSSGSESGDMAADLGAHFRSSKGGMMGGSSESESGDEAADFAASMGAMGCMGGWSSASEDGSDVSRRLEPARAGSDGELRPDAETCAASLGSLWAGSSGFSRPGLPGISWDFPGFPGIFRDFPGFPGIS